VGLSDIKKYVKIDSGRAEYEEKDLNVISVRPDQNYSDDSLEVERI